MRASLSLWMMLWAGLAAFAALGASAPISAAPAGNEALIAARTAAATLIMVDDPACSYCRRWNREVGSGYHRTAEGRVAPLKRVGRDSKVLLNFAPVIYTPTFILAKDGRELGRITGYPGQHYFWEELTALMSRAGIGAKG